MATSSSVGRKGSRYRLDNIPTNTFTPRTYQIQLLDAALQRNTLLCQGCPSSKLFLALMVAKEMSSTTRTALIDGGKRTFYITDSEEDVESVASTLPHHTDLKVGCYPPTVSQVTEHVKDSCAKANLEDEFSPDSKDCSAWKQLVEDNNIVVCTGTNLIAALKTNLVQLKSANLLIFDDCHRAAPGTGSEISHPYADIVSLVRWLGKEGTPEPRILGVTAAIAGTDCSDPGQLKVTISSMERAMHAKAQTSMLILTERFGCRPRQRVIRCDLEDNDPIGIDEEQAQLRQTMEGLLLRDYHFFLDCREQLIEQAGGKDPGETPRQVLEQCLTILSVLGPWCCSSVGEYFHMQMEKIVKQERCDIHKRCLRCVMTTLRVLTRTFEGGFHPDYCVQEFLAYTTPKVRALVNSLRRFKPEVDFIIVSNSSDDPDGDDSALSDLSDDDEDEDSMSGSDAEDDQNKTAASSSKPVHIAVKRTADGNTERVTGFLEEEEKNLCGIVFVENRYIAFGLSKVIEEVCSWDEDLCFVKSCHITGQGLKGSGGAGSAKQQRTSRACKRQEEALRKFRTQEVNLVIATPELEEGIDIPKCNLVVRFDPPKDYRSYTLSKGRARARDASFIILLDADTYEGFQSRLEVFKGIEQVLLGDTKNQPQPKVKEYDGDTEDSGGEQNIVIDDPDDQDVLPPYKTIPSSSNSPQVTMQGAIALVNRYCAKLPSDAFTHLTPHCRLQRVAGRYIAHLRLPINSPVKQELEGPAMRSKKMAKMAVALKMCGILHEKGELDDQLLPVGKEMFVYEEEEEWADEDDTGGQARPGTTKRKQYYTKKVANAMLDCQPKPGQRNFLYLISLNLTGPITEEQNTRGRLIYAPEDTRQTIGLLLDKPIPQMPNFPVYTRSGEVTASVDLLCSDLVLSEMEISNLLRFHHFVFSGVLHLEKDPMEFNPDQAEYGCVVVPLNGKDRLKIDWEFVEKVIQFMSSQKRADVTKRKRGSGRGSKSGEDKESSMFKFCIEDFEDAVVMPSYRNMDQPQHFYVAEIRTDLNPLSPFPSPELYKTFQDYYTTKYGLEISCKDQPLLDVDHTSARLNLLTPRYMNPKGMALPTSSAETKRARRENLQQKQILVPELCDVHIFPASLWRKAVCLPAILYRTNCLLLAEELRQRVANQTGIGQEELPPNFRFPQLDFGFETSPEKLMESESYSGDSGKNNPGTSICAVESKSSPSSPEKEQKESSCIYQKKTSKKVATSPTPATEKTDAYRKVLSPAIPSPYSSADVSIDKADSAASSDTDSGIMSSGSDTNLGPSPPLTAVSESEGSKKEYTEEDDKKQCNFFSNLASEANLAPSQPTVIASSSTLQGQSCTKSCTSNKSTVVTTIAPADSGGLICNDQYTTSGANHISPISYLHDLAAKSSVSQAIDTDKASVFCNRGPTLTPDPTDSSKPTTADICVSSSKSSNESNHIKSQECGSDLTTPAATNVPCPSLPSIASPLCIPCSSTPILSFTSSAASLSHNSTECNPGCESQDAHHSTNSQPISDESLQQPPHGLVEACNSLSHSNTQNHQTCVQQISSDVKQKLRSNEKNETLLDSRSIETFDTTPCDKEKTATIDSNTSTNSSPFHSESFTKDGESRQAASEFSADSQCSDTSIIMNTLGQELCGLDIDLICPTVKHTYSSSTFQDNGSSEKSNDRSGSNAKCPNLEGEHVNGWDGPSEKLSFDEQGANHEFGNRDMTSDADIIKFSFNADVPEKTSTEANKVIIDTWSSDVEKERKQNQENLRKTSKGRKEGTIDVGTAKIENNDVKQEAHCVNSNPNVPKFDEQPPPSECLNQTQVVSQSEAPTLSEQSILKNFDIGVWNVREGNKSSAQYIDTSKKIHSASSANEIPLTSLCDHMSLDEDRDLSNFPGPSPCLLLQALTMSNANDFFSLERLETIGDSFLKYAITVYLYCCYPGIHEGKLSYLRSKQVSNYNLYRLGRRKCLAERMVATKFEPYENWLPPCFIINEERRRGPVPKVIVVPPGPRDDMGTCLSSRGNAGQQVWPEDAGVRREDEAGQFHAELAWLQHSQEQDQQEEAGGAAVTPGGGNSGGNGGRAGAGLIPYSLQQHHGLPDKSLADCVEALIGCYLTTCGRKAALLFMSWLGLRVLPKRVETANIQDNSSPWKVSEQQFAELRCPPSPMFFPSEANQARLEQLLEGFDGLEETIQYKFRDRSYLLQAFTHASYHYNTITDCYQRIEFLGDAILDYVITRHLYEDSQKHSPGILTDLRSALVNNNIFAALAVKWGFHKYFKAVSPALFQVIDTFVKFQEGKDQDHIDIDEEYQEVSMEEPVPEDGGEEEDEDDEEEVEMEIPKALGDIFESVAGAIYLDSGMSLDAVWKVYYRMMKPHIDKYLKSIPKSPVRELLETEPETAKFERPQRTMNGKVRVTVNVVGKGEYSGVGRNYRIAKSAAAKRALRSIRFMAQNLS